MTLRVCTRCRNAKPADLFAVDPHGTGGRSARCKACKAEIARERRATASRKPAPIVELRPGLQLVTTPVEPGEAAPVAVTPAPDDGGGRHAHALEAALAAAGWIEAADAPTVEYARALAARLDAMSLEGAVSESPQYLATLKALRLDPASRARGAGPAETGARVLDVSGY